ncbi:hypothetical protein [Anatilimnocola floriformis]|uniref:hypothetical protein n=1 Tax=Anatilimnocola floriformis TaxID=2948575 RepID=UPI0020C4E89F|nr:hypothetical protein [Anatilimnocola floriformis]
MRTMLVGQCGRLVLAFLGILPAICAAQQTAPTIVCPALSDEDRTSSRPVALMVHGTLQPAAAGTGLELRVHEVLFGNDPGPVIPFPKLSELLERGEPGFSERGFSKQQPSGVFSLQSTLDSKQLGFGFDRYAHRHQFLPPEELATARVIATVRLDRLVLGSRAIVVARPRDPPDGKIANAGPLSVIPQWTPVKETDAPPEIASRKQTIVVERILSGGLEPGQEIKTTLAAKSSPVPLSGAGPFIYFIMDNKLGVHDLAAVWDLAREPQVVAALARREQYPRSRETVAGQKIDCREVQFMGTPAEAIALLGSSSNIARRLANARLLNGQADIKAEVIRAIESHLLSDDWDVADPYFQQWRLLRILQLLEGEEPLEHIRLADLMLERAFAGDSFPQPVSAKVARAVVQPQQEPSDPYAKFDAGQNHSLAWLLLALPPEQVASRYLDRLKRLREMASYGWGQEAQGIIDRQQLNDYVALPAALARTEHLKPLATWKSSEIKLTQHDLRELRFAPNNRTLGLRSERDERLIWDSTTGQLEQHTKPVREYQQPVPANGAARNTTFATAENGERWTFKKMGFEPAHGRYKQDYVPRSAWIEVQANAPTETGARIQTKVPMRPSESNPLCGLVPGGKFIHLRTNIYDGRNLQLISAADVLGGVTCIQFSATGDRFAICAQGAPVSQVFFPRSIDPDETFFRSQPDWRRLSPAKIIRVHDTQTGDTLFAVKSPYDVTHIALSPDGNRVAAMSKDLELSVWQLVK